MAKHYIKRFVLSVVCLLLVVTAFFGCNKGKGGEQTTLTTTQTTVVTTTQPTTVPTTAAPTEPSVLSYKHVNLPDEHGERRTPNVHYYVPYSQRVDASYFNDAVFIGDSVSMMLDYYNMSTSCFGEATFLTSGSLSAGNALWSLDNPKSVHPSFRGQKVSLADGVAMSGKKKVYIMLGVNEIGWTGPQGSIDSLKAVVDTILAKSPDVRFYMQSVTPLSFDRGALNMETVNQYNALLSELCKERGWYYLDVASVFKNEKGYLIPEYCSDLNSMGIHFNNEACKIWAEYLYTHAPQVPVIQQSPVQQTQVIQQNQVPQTQYVQIVPVEVHTIVVQVPETNVPATNQATKPAVPQATKPPVTQETSPIAEETFDEAEFSE